MGARINRARVGVVVLALGALVATGCSVITYPSPGRTITPSQSLVTPIKAHTAGAPLPPEVPVTGEGLLRIRMSAPGTAWASPTDTSVVVEATVDGGAPQTYVLFAGASSFAYEGFTGPLTTGDHTLSVSVRDDLSITSGAPAVLVHRIDLLVVPNDDPAYLALSHAPVLYGRGVSAHSDTPLFQFVDDTPAPGGGRRLEYTTTWSNEDAGTGIIPWLLWGGYGRTTDIETTAIVTVDAAGAVTSARYHTCAACPPDYPEDLAGLDHSYVDFAGSYFGGHPILRVATGNNVLKDTGTTAFRFQQALVNAPLPGETRESAMDARPVGYKVMGQEMQREQAGYTTDPLTAVAGDARQYAIVDLDTTPVGTKAVGVELQIDGDPHWYSNDFASGQTFFYRSGHARTAVKLPLDWHAKAITGARLRLYPTTPAPPTTPSITVHGFRVLEVQGNYFTGYRQSVTAPEVVVNP